MWPAFRQMITASVSAYESKVAAGKARQQASADNQQKSADHQQNAADHQQNAADGQQTSAGTKQKPAKDHINKNQESRNNNNNQESRKNKQDHSSCCSCSIPSAGEVEAYAVSRGEAPVDISGFMAYNATLNWKCLPNWQSAYDLWVKRDKERQQQQQQGRKVLKDQDYHQRDVAESCEIPEWQRQAMAEWLKKEGALTNGQNATAQATASG